MKKYIYLIIILLFNLKSTAQTITFADDVAPIFFKNCLPCHQKNGGAPFELITYDDIKDKSSLIKYVINKRIMPPWKADHNYRSFLNERILAEDEIKTINQWVEEGMQGGNLDEIKYPESGSFKAEQEEYADADIVIKMPEHTISVSNKDEFVNYVSALKLANDKFMIASKVIPGNVKLLHHAAIEADTLKRFDNNVINKTPLEYEELGYYNPPFIEFCASYLPGMSLFKLPKGMASKVYKKSKIIFAMHYSPNSLQNQKDKTELHLYFAKDTVNLRETKLDMHKPNFDRTKTYTVPHDSIYTINMITPSINQDVSVFAIQPHMHLLGKSWKIWAVTREKDTIPLISIPQWDFNWQTIYYYPSLVIIPQGSVFYAEATYDNTVNNPRNPNSPPKDVKIFGMNTLDEMCEYYIYYTPYKKGDEQLEIW